MAWAARTGDVQAIRTLLQAGADPEEASGMNHWTPLMHAIHKNQRGSVVSLLDGGAKVNARFFDC
ncbi:MAG: ankyrin repeat domain-containing protein [Acidobacteriia bacterium]|nr:ankyrin repeat domain-containing protein [Terriglobia bacterium]